MSVSLGFALVWGLMAALIALGLRQLCWTVAWVLIGSGVPLLGWMTYENGPVLGSFGLVAGALMLLAPVQELIRRGGQHKTAD